jgi:hypothetical protein
MEFAIIMNDHYNYRRNIESRILAVHCFEIRTRLLIRVIAMRDFLLTVYNLIITKSTAIFLSYFDFFTITSVQ